MKKVLVLLNEKSGTLAASATHDEPQRITAGFELRGVRAEVRSVDPARLRETAEAAHRDGYAAVVAGGGDGTLNTIAAALLGGATPFAVLPLGTHNHFAKEMKVPLDLDAAAAALADAVANGRVKDLDVGTVNGRVFLNFSGIGLHPQLVRQRDAEHKAIKRHQLLRSVLRKFTKILAMFFALLQALRRLPVMRVLITSSASGETIRRLTPSVVVCNNPYQMKVFGVENVSHTDRSILNVYVARATGPIGLVRLLLASAVRRLDNLREFETICQPSVRIAVHRRRSLPVSIDGEVVELKTPLEYGVRRGGLRVVVPEGNAE
jgi:diacylglycerol kinase family enzyme